MNPREDRTELRLKLYAGGFEPLANKSKMCLIPEWSTFDIDPERIQSWARSRKFSDTGIRCGDVVALDWDIDDKDLLNKLLDAVVENGIVQESSFVRIGRPPRELWVYRTSEKIGKRTTGHFMIPDRGTASPGATGGNGFAVEVLGKGCQFAAYGQRDEDTEYAWPVDSLVDHQYMDLPEITLAQVEALKDFCILFFELNGLERRSPAGGTDAGYTHAYDLTPDMLFDVQDFGPMSIADMADAFRVSPNEVLRCKVDALRPTSGSFAGMASLVNGHVCISDHGTYTSHFPAEADEAAALEKLGALLQERFPAPAPEPVTDLTIDDSYMDPRDDLDTNLRKALSRYAYVVGVDVIYDMARPALGGMKVDAFRNLTKNLYFEERGKQGGKQITWLHELYMMHPDRVSVVTAQMRPDMTWPLFEEGGDTHFNTYRQIRLPAHGDASVGMEFIEHLLPIEAERRYFLQWLSYKYQHPAVRGPGIIMVAHDQYGTGRGSLMQLIRQMFATGLVNEIDFKTLAGTTYQSQYNDWLSDNLIVAVNEAQETATTMSKWQTRSNAYERLKEIIDPSNQHMNAIRKGVKNSAARTFCSVVVMTNHMDSVVLPANDRRLAILENGSPRSTEYWTSFHAWRENPANIGAFIAELLKVDLSDYSPFAPPLMTAAKADMVDAGSSELDRVFADAMARYSNTVIVREQVVLVMEDLLADSSAEVPDDWQKIVERMFLRATRKVTTVNDRVKIEGRQRTVRSVGRPAPEVVSTHEKLIETVLSNGALVRPIKASGQVIAFGGRR